MGLRSLFKEIKERAVSIVDNYILPGTADYLEYRALLKEEAKNKASVPEPVQLQSSTPEQVQAQNQQKPGFAETYLPTFSRMYSRIAGHDSQNNVQPTAQQTLEDCLDLAASQAGKIHQTEHGDRELMNEDTANKFLMALYNASSSSIPLGGKIEGKLRGIMNNGNRLAEISDSVYDLVYPEGLHSATEEGLYNFRDATAAVMKSALKRYVADVEEKAARGENVGKEWARVGDYMRKFSNVFRGDNDMDNIMERALLGATISYLNNKNSTPHEATAIRLMYDAMRYRGKEAFNRVQTRINNYIQNHVKSAVQKYGEYSFEIRAFVTSKVNRIKDIIYEGISEVDRYFNAHPAEAKEAHARERTHAQEMLKSHGQWLAQPEYAR